MAFFKFRPGAQVGSEGQASGTDNQTVDHLRRRARQRLIGAAVLVVLAVAGFPMVFDTQPRPVSTDLSIDIPAKTKVSPDTPPAPLASTSGMPPPDAGATDLKHGLSDKEELVASKAAVADAPKESPVENPPAKMEPAAGKAAPTSADGGKNGKAAAEHRYVVQVGAFLDDAKVRETRAKLEKAGLKTYTQVVEAKDGKRTRVRLGPFNSKAEADSVADKAKSLQLQAVILTY
ncbi:MAG: hypothetical protein RIT26_1870 [Pseudomonadota bacterium]|jgi:DedD protein